MGLFDGRGTHWLGDFLSAVMAANEWIDVALVAESKGLKPAPLAGASS